ncbi:MAG: transglutaminase family protein [Cyanobium sp.]
MNWMDEVARSAEERLIRAGIRLTLGGEPTLVPREPQGAEWSITADGPTKLPIARQLARELQRDVWPGSTLLWCPGKRYEGETNPRWALRLILGVDGAAPVRWQGPCQPGLTGRLPQPDEGAGWLEQLGQRLGLALEPVPLRDRNDPARRVWAVPLTATPSEPGEPPEAAILWQTHAWPLAEELRELIDVQGPAGLRLPLQHLPPEVPRQVLTLEIGDDGWELFLPPLLRRPLGALLQAVADGLGELAAPRLSGLLPADADGHWQTLGLTADPGVLEINLPICHGWADYDRWLRHIETAGASLGLRSWKEDQDGRQEGTGGGNHLLWGGPSLAEHPFFPRPAWLVGILRYWQHHPCLGYLFSPPSVGPASQSPRPDEAAGTIVDLELAYRALERVGDREAGAAGPDHRSLIGETLRHLHADRSGNNHRSEISFDKFWNPGTTAGCLGLVEFRALESLPKVEWSSAIALLWSALAAHLLEPARRPQALRDWGAALHDRMLLPSQLWADLAAILADLAADGLALDVEVFRQIWRWRFPPLLQWQEGAGGAAEQEQEASLELLPALEPWPLICDVPREGGFTSRFVDASLRRFEVISNAAFRRHGQLWLNGRPLPLPPAEAEGEAALLAVRFRQQRLYPCLHPSIDPHLPLVLAWRLGAASWAYRLDGEGRRFEPLSPAEASAATTAGNASASPWQGRLHADAVTIDLRID